MANVNISNTSNFPTNMVRRVEKAMDRAGWTNPYLRIAVLSTIAKESEFELKNEYSYRNTSNERLRNLFGSRLSEYSDSELSNLKKDDVAFYEAVYGGRYGNREYGDGYKYRGRGFNGLTFRGTYEKYAKQTGHPIDKKPSLMNDPDVASDVLIAFLGNRLKNIPYNSRFPVRNINEFEDLNTAIYTVVSANAGWGKNISYSHPETLQRAKMFSRLFSYPEKVYERFKKFGGEALSKGLNSDSALFIKRNWLPLSVLVLGLGTGGFLLVRRIWK